MSDKNYDQKDFGQKNVWITYYEGHITNGRKTNSPGYDVELLPLKIEANHATG